VAANAGRAAGASAAPSPRGEVSDGSDQTRRSVLLLLAGIVALIVLLGSAFALVGTLVWTRNVEVESAGDRVIEIQREGRPASPPGDVTRDVVDGADGSVDVTDERAGEAPSGASGGAAPSPR